MPYFQYPDEFPLSSLPPLIRDAVIEAQQITQAPLGLVAASALGAVSLVCQNLIDVCRLNTLRGPVSLFLLTLAESGERKNAVDKLLMEPLYQQEMLLYSRHKNELTTWKNKEELLKAQKKALLSKLNKELRKGADESETLRQLEALQKNRGEKPVRYKFIFNDATTYKFEMGKGITLRDGKDVTIVATGILVGEAIKAGELLAAEGIDARIINIHTIKPIDKELL